MKKLVAIGVIWLGCAVLWVILGSTILLRTQASSGALSDQVYGLWGPPGIQAPPRAVFQKPEITEETVTEENTPGQPTKKKIQKQVMVDVPLTLDASRVVVKLALEQRKKGLSWFPTYVADFRGNYTFLNEDDAAHEVSVRFPLQASGTGSAESRWHETPLASSASFDGFAIVDERGKSIDFEIAGSEARFVRHFAPGERHSYSVRYRTRGTSSWRYLMTQGTGSVRNFTLNVQTNFQDVDFPPDTVSATNHSASAEGWQGEWRFASLISGAPIGVQLPELLNPGPLASKVTFFAPVSLLFFFFVVAVLARVQRREMHPMHYFLLACAFFAFHLLFAYLVDHLAIVPSFAIASGVSLFLVVSYARLFVGYKFALREMALAELLYLVLFSGTFLWEGFTGLAIAIGAVVTLFFVMQVTGRTSWAQTAPEKITAG